tara:strand:+ start:131 stop:388 length:258 start_codon:yes stop_codon:yes gene_type:complete
MQAVNYYIVIDKIREKDRNIGGFLIKEEIDTDNKYLRGKIITKGNLVEGLNEGDIVHYDKRKGHGIHWKDKLYEVIKVGDVVLVE